MSNKPYTAVTVGPPPPYSDQAPPQQYGWTPPGQPQVFVPGPQPVHPGTSVQIVAPAQGAVVTPVIVAGNCPACRAGILVNEFTCCGIFLGIFFFPIGLICCFLMQERRCTNCRATFGN